MYMYDVKKAELLAHAQSIRDRGLIKTKRDSLIRALRGTFDPHEQDIIKRQIADLEEQMLYV